MGSTKLLLLVVVFLAMCVGMCRPWGDDVVEDANTKAEEAKQFAAAAVHDAEEETRSWADKFSKSFGVEEDREKQATQNMKYKAEDAASRATGTMKSAASGASEYASQKGTDAKDAISGAMKHGKEKTYYDGDAEVIKMPTDSINDAKDTMGETVGQARERMADTYEDAKQKMYTASDKASSMPHNAKDNMAESMEYGRDRAANVYDQGKQKINMASEKFYDAKDKASDVYDESRHKINDMISDNANEDTKQRMKVTSQGIYDVKNTVKGAMGCGGDKAVDAFDEANEGMNMAGDKANDAKDHMGVKMADGKDKVAETFDQAKHEVGEAYVSAKNTMTEGAKTKYEAVKEKASDATGDFGAKMRNSPNL